MAGQRGDRATRGPRVELAPRCEWVGATAPTPRPDGPDRRVDRLGNDLAQDLGHHLGHNLGQVLLAEIAKRTLRLLTREPPEENLDAIPKAYWEASFGPRASSATS